MSPSPKKHLWMIPPTNVAVLNLLASNQMQTKPYVCQMYRATHTAIARQHENCQVCQLLGLDTTEGGNLSRQKSYTTLR